MLNCVHGRDNDGVMNEEAIMLEEVLRDSFTSMRIKLNCVWT